MRNLALVLLLMTLVEGGIAQSTPKPHQPLGKIEGDNIYTNTVLGLRVTLPGKWRLMVPTKYAQYAGTPQAPPDAQCRGPLCRPDIDEALETDSSPVQALFLTGYKLQPDYLNRQRYPLKRFAEAMLQGSLSPADWLPLGNMSEVQFAGRPAYRLLVHDPSKPQKKGFGFVFDSNGYICLLVGTDVSQAQDLLPAVEAMTGDKSPSP